MSQSVDKLKELLFQPENDAINALQKRIDAVFDRAGTTERFQASVATVLDGALRDAEVQRHDQVAAAIAPLIVKTVKVEIHNSTDDLVEALYPATGRMVKAYVASAIKDLTDQINRRLEANPVMLRLNAWLSGRSAAELALADSQRLKVDDVFLIRRGTGELVARWPQDGGGANYDHVMGGVLTAINEFTAEAFKAEGSTLRQIDLGDSQVYLRVSPTYMLAAKCSGTAPATIEQVFDDEFLTLMDRHNAALDTETKAGDLGSKAAPLLQGLAEKLETRLAAQQPGHDTLQRGVKPLTLLAMLIGIPLAAWLAWSVYVDWRTGQVSALARQTVEGETGMRGYPAEIKVTERGRVVTMQGLAPSDAVKARLLSRLRSVLPEVDVHDQMSAVPAGTVDVTPIQSALKLDQATFQANVKAEAERQAQVRARRLLERTGKLFQAALPDAGAGEAARLSALATEAQGIADALREGPDGDAVAAITDRVRALGRSIQVLAASTLGPSSASRAEDAGDTPAAADGLVDAAERAAAAAKALVDLSQVKRRLEAETERLRIQIAAIPPPVPPQPVPQPTPRERLERFARAHAIFFLDGTAFRDEAAVRTTVEELAGLMALDTSIVRVVGYTDDAGTPARNTALARDRAAAVAAALTARGVPANRLVTLSRVSSENNVSPVSGSGSANRRVEFEIGFIGEGSP
jgi:outer membrane protein OmpA-like peptidoglycan-associated protein